jgi:hypothetical protein
MFQAALASALAAWPHDTQENFAWLARFALSTRRTRRTPGKCCGGPPSPAGRPRAGPCTPGPLQEGLGPLERKQVRGMAADAGAHLAPGLGEARLGDVPFQRDAGADDVGSGDTVPATEARAGPAASVAPPLSLGENPLGGRRSSVAHLPDQLGAVGMLAAGEPGGDPVGQLASGIEVGGVGRGIQDRLDLRLERAAGRLGPATEQLAGRRLEIADQEIGHRGLPSSAMIGTLDWYHNVTIAAGLGAAPGPFGRAELRRPMGHPSLTRFSRNRNHRAGLRYTSSRTTRSTTPPRIASRSGAARICPESGGDRRPRAGPRRRRPQRAAPRRRYSRVADLISSFPFNSLTNASPASVTCLRISP